MLFNSLTFLVFFSCVFGLFWLIPDWNKRKWLLLVASYLFYAAWSPVYVLLLLGSTVLDWWLARGIARAAQPGRRRTLLVVSLASNLGMLGYFKYGGFLLENFITLCAALGIVFEPAQSSIVLPIGISFYTFASLSYTIDVYRREVHGEYRLRDYALFVSFFPHLVAGPIVRASYLLPQIVHPRTPTENQIGWGLALVAIGLFLKTVLADAVLAPVADEIFASPDKFGAVNTWIGVLSFSGQIYFDFSAYSLCAIGLARCFGFSFPQNFHYPYAARGFSDFWRRWHISLSTWLRDYLYIPLGGNRHGELRTCCSLLVTMLIGGLWHGASWMFVLWGLLHGLFLIAERLLRGRVSGALLTSLRPLPEIATFLLVTLAWIPFRATSLADTWAVLRGLADFSKPALSDPAHLAALIAVIATVASHLAMRDTSIEQLLSRFRPTAQAAAFGACLTCLFLFSGGDQRAFIYFQF
jgi:alginate O-acetyltransferase complex protein AlgI